MGWWKINNVAEGRIDFDAAKKRIVGTPACANALPGTDDPNMLYNGDGPADVMEPALDKIAYLYKEAWGRYPSRGELLGVFNFCANTRIDPEDDFRYVPLRNPDGSVGLRRPD